LRAFLRVCMSKKESKNSIPKTLSHPLIFISEGDQSTSFWEDDFSLLCWRYSGQKIARFPTAC